MRKVDRGDYSKIMEDAYVDSPHSIGFFLCFIKKIKKFS